VRLFSAPKRIGVENVATLLWDWAHPPGKPEALGQPDTAWNPIEPTELDHQ
jgi:hypothetical protein